MLRHAAGYMLGNEGTDSPVTLAQLAGVTKLVAMLPWSGPIQHAPVYHAGRGANGSVWLSMT